MLYIQKRFSPLFSICSVVGTLVILAVRVWLRLEGASLSDNWAATTEIILDVLPWAGVSAFILALIVVKVAELLAGLFSDKEASKVNEESSQE